MKGFATGWLGKNELFPKLISEDPVHDTGIIVVVPAYDEPDIETLLVSLEACNRPECRVEVIVVVNAPAEAAAQSLTNNRKCVEIIESRKKDTFFRLYVFDAGQPNFRDWGVGMARKTGMDEALRRFSFLGRTDGIIANLDGDCTVDGNYFTELENRFLKRQELNACSIFFEHPVRGDLFPGWAYDSVMSYEIHLRYYNMALRYAGFPYVFHTVGSSLAVRASAYMKAGGMNRKKAGEDFYFIQKLIPLGGYFNLNSTTVRPSPRASFRVPFGTGAAVSKLASQGETEYLTYNPAAFEQLKILFSLLPLLRRNDKDEIRKMPGSFDKSMSEFLVMNSWEEKLDEIRNNTSSDITFRKRFFEWFNMFRVMKYLNYSHSGTFDRIDPFSASALLLQKTGQTDIPTEKYEMLKYLRNAEREIFS